MIANDLVLRDTQFACLGSHRFNGRQNASLRHGPSQEFCHGLSLSKLVYENEHSTETFKGSVALNEYKLTYKP